MIVKQPDDIESVSGAGPSGRALDLRHAARSQIATQDELARLLLNVAQAVPQVRGPQLQHLPSSTAPAPPTATSPIAPLWTHRATLSACCSTQAMPQVHARNCRHQLKDTSLVPA